MTLAALPPRVREAYIPKIGVAQALHLLGALARFVVARRPDVVHIHSPQPLQSMRCPRVRPARTMKQDLRRLMAALS